MFCDMQMEIEIIIIQILWLIEIGEFVETLHVSKETAQHKGIKQMKTEVKYFVYYVEI